jgi:AAA family ATP:ADP antiporter
MNGHERRSFLERALGVITDVRAGEALIALLMTLNGFILLMAYSCIKPVREALILAQPRGAEYKVYMAAATAIVLFFAVPAYSRFSRDMSRNRLVIGVTLFFASNLLIFYGLGKLQGSSLLLALGFYLWIAVFNMMIVAQFWAFANDLYTEEAGKRLFPLIGLGASVGAVAGSAAAKAVVTQVGLLEMMLLGAALLVGSAAVTQIVHWRDVGEARTAVSRQIATGPIGGTTIEAFRVVFAGRYLLLIAIFSLLFTLVKTNGDYLLSRIVESASTQAVASGALEAHNVKEYIGSFFAGYEFKIYLISLIIQAFIVSRAVKYLGVRGAFYVLPIVALGDAALMAVFPVLAAVRIGKTAESATDYSLNNTLRNMLWLPTSRRAKYLAKQATDTFFVRAGDMVSAVVVFIGIHAFGLSVRGFAAVNAVLVLVWFLLARAILKERARIRDESHDDDPGFDTPPQPAAL